MGTRSPHKVSPPSQPSPHLCPKTNPARMDGGSGHVALPQGQEWGGFVPPQPPWAAWVLRGSLQDRDQRGDGEDGPSLSHGSSGPRRDVPGDKRAAGIN